MMSSRLRAALATVLSGSVVVACSDPGNSTPTPEATSQPKLLGNLRLRHRASASPSASVSAPPSSASPAASSAPAASSSSGPATGLAKEGCPETEKGKRACTAEEFEKAWKASPSASTFPSDAKYKVTGKITKLEPRDKAKGQTGDLRVYMKADPKDVGFLFPATSKDLDAVRKLKVGADATFTCSFGGLEELGAVTLSDCSL
ncbi:MAG: hypothetical protein U0414_30335 [Polyangiaceae bacterium]